MKVLILTTATNRPTLHTRTFHSYKQFLNEELDITWIINIDTVSGFNASAIETRDNIKNIFYDRPINFMFVIKQDGWFNRAVRTLLSEAKSIYKKFDCIIWLEDDWLYNSKTRVTFLDTFDFDLDGKKSEDILNRFFINLLSKRIQVKDITLQPTIWSILSFKNFINIFENNEDLMSCPETILESSYDSKNIIRFQNPLFEDAGREWLSYNGLKKLPKKHFGSLNSNYRKI